MIMDLFTASTQADGLCRVYCKAQADSYLKCDDAVLVRLKTTDNREKIIWVSEETLHGELLEFVRAFNEDSSAFEVDVGNIKTIETIDRDSEIFCFDNSTYYLHKAMNGNDCIRRLWAVCSQSVVEQIERQEVQGDDIESIFLSNFYLRENGVRKYALTLWGIAYSNSYSYMPVFAEDYHFVREYSLGAFEREEVKVGEIFKNNGYYYKLRRNEAGELYLESSKMVFNLNKKQKIQKPPEFTAKIIMMNFRK